MGTMTIRPTTNTNTTATTNPPPQARVSYLGRLLHFITHRSSNNKRQFVSTGDQTNRNGPTEPVSLRSIWNTLKSCFCCGRSSLQPETETEQDKTGGQSSPQPKIETKPEESSIFGPKLMEELTSRLIEIINNPSSEAIAKMELDINMARDSHNLIFTSCFFEAASEAQNHIIDKIPVELYKLNLKCHMALLEEIRPQKPKNIRNVIFTHILFMSPVFNYISSKEGNDYFLIELAQKYKKLFSELIASCDGAPSSSGINSDISGMTGFSALATRLQGYVDGFNSGPPPLNP